MSSELVKKLEDREQTLRENLFYESAEDYDQGYLHGFFEAMAIVEQHEAQQMNEPFYQLDEKQMTHLRRLKDMVVLAKIPINKVFPMLYKLPIDKNNNLLLIHAFYTVGDRAGKNGGGRGGMNKNEGEPQLREVAEHIKAAIECLDDKKIANETYDDHMKLSRLRHAIHDVFGEVIVTNMYLAETRRHKEEIIKIEAQDERKKELDKLMNKTKGRSE